MSLFGSQVPKVRPISEHEAIAEDWESIGTDLQWSIDAMRGELIVREETPPYNNK